MAEHGAQTLVGFAGSGIEDDAADWTVEAMNRADVGFPGLVVLLRDVLGHDFTQARFARAAALDDIATAFVDCYNVVVFVQHLKVVLRAVDNGGFGGFDEAMECAVVASRCLSAPLVSHQYCSDSLGKSTARTSLTY